MNPSTLFSSYTIADNTNSFWRIGPLELVVESKPLEWRLHWSYNNDPLSAHYHFADNYQGNFSHMNTERVAFCHKKSNLNITPRLADRSIVIRPEVPFYIPGKEEVTLYFTTPLWLCFDSDHSTHIREIPSHRLSDTWFGPADHTGELCYAAKISARLNVNELKLLYHRAVTSLVIKNRASDPLFLERIKLPVPFLSLYRGEDGVSYTEEIAVEREKNGKTVQISLGKSPAKQFPVANKLIGPRRAMESTFMNRTFNTIFSTKE